LSILTIDKDVLYHVYILSILNENNYEIICLTKTTIVLWKTLELKLAWYLYEKKGDW